MANKKYVPQAVFSEADTFSSFETLPSTLNHLNLLGKIFQNTSFPCPVFPRILASFTQWLVVPWIKSRLQHIDNYEATTRNDTSK